MTRPPPPPRPHSTLDRQLARLRDDLADIPIDPDFGRRVEDRIRADRVLARQDRRRTIPGWAAVAAAVLLTLGAGLSTRSAAPTVDRGGHVPLAPPPQVAPEPEPDLTPPAVEEPSPEDDE